MQPGPHLLPADLALEYRLRLALSAVLRGTSRVLSRLARRLATANKAPALHATHLEFYAAAGAPEGAVYADGVLVGYWTGVHRL